MGNDPTKNKSNTKRKKNKNGISAQEIFNEKKVSATENSTAENPKNTSTFDLEPILEKLDDMSNATEAYLKNEVYIPLLTEIQQSFRKNHDSFNGISNFALNTNNNFEDVKKNFNAVLKREEILAQSLNSVESKVNGSREILQRDLQSIAKLQRDSRDILSSSINALEKKLNGIADNTDMIQSLPGKIDGISQILSDKGLQLKQEFPAINHDEETLAELAEYGEKILQELAIAARWYARKLPEINAHENQIKNLTAANEDAVNTARKNGEDAGRKTIIENLLQKYGDIQRLMNPSEDNALEQLKILSTFLSNEGVEPIYTLNEELEITADNIMDYEHNIENLQLGKIIITSPGYTFNNKTVEKAKYEFTDDFRAKQNAVTFEYKPAVAENPTENLSAEFIDVVPENFNVDENIVTIQPISLSANEFENNSTATENLTAEFADVAPENLIATENIVTVQPINSSANEFAEKNLNAEPIVIPEQNLNADSTVESNDQPTITDNNSVKG